MIMTFIRYRVSLSRELLSHDFLNQDDLVFVLQNSNAFGALSYVLRRYAYLICYQVYVLNVR